MLHSRQQNGAGKSTLPGIPHGFPPVAKLELQKCARPRARFCRVLRPDFCHPLSLAPQEKICRCRIAHSPDLRGFRPWSGITPGSTPNYLNPVALARARAARELRKHVATLESEIAELEG